VPKVLSGILVLVGTVVWVGSAAGGDCCRKGQKPWVRLGDARLASPTGRGKMDSPLSCRLELADATKAGQVQNVRLTVKNRFHAGTLRIRLRVPPPVRTEREVEPLSPLSLELGEERQFVFPVKIPTEGSHQLEAVASLETPEGNRVSSSAFLVLGLPRPEVSAMSVMEATSAEGRRLRIHVSPVSSPVREEAQ